MSVIYGSVFAVTMDELRKLGCDYWCRQVINMDEEQRKTAIEEMRIVAIANNDLPWLLRGAIANTIAYLKSHPQYVVC